MIVVTGAAGFIGSHLVDQLRIRGLDTVGIDRRPISRNRGSVAVDLAVPDADIDDLLGRAEAVFHLAARPGVRDDHAGIEEARWRDNVLTTRRVLAATPARTPLIVASSSSVYGGSRHGGVSRACREQDVLAPRGGYATSKVAVEGLCKERADSGGRVTIVRPFTVAGERQRPDMAIARWLDASRLGATITVFGSLQRTRDITDIRDVVEGLIRILERGVGGTLNLGTGRGRTLEDILETVFRVTGFSTDVRQVPARSEEVAETLADTTRCQELLDLDPHTDLSALVTRQWRWSVADSREARTLAGASPRSGGEV